MNELRNIYRTPLKGNKPAGVKMEITYSDGSKSGVNYVPAWIPERYGSNPHQLFSLLVDENAGFRLKEIKSGKGGFSATNIEDAFWAAELLKYFGEPACVVMKHLNPSGAALSTDVKTAFLKSWWVDWIAAFGSVVGWNRPITRDLAEMLTEKSRDGKSAKYFIEAVAAPEYEEGAVGLLGNRSDLRVLRYDGLDKMPKYVGDCAAPVIKTLGGADGMLSFEDRFLTRIITDEDLLVKEVEQDGRKLTGLGVVTKKQPTRDELRDLRYAWYAAAVLRSNATAIVKDDVLIGPGTGQQDRVRSVRYAIGRVYELRAQAREDGVEDIRNSIHDYSLTDAVLASEALFPFDDSIIAIKNTGIKAVAQTGGSLRDKEVIEAADNHGIAMIFTGERCFSHH